MPKRPERLTALDSARVRAGRASKHRSGSTATRPTRHFEIHASEPQLLIDFYSGLLGWRFTQFGDAPYWSIETGEGAIGNAAGLAGHGINGGLLQRPGPKPELGAPAMGCNIVVGVDDVDSLMRRGVELGGTEGLAAADVQGVGRVGYLLDLDNNVFGLISAVMSDGTTGMGGSA